MGKRLLSPALMLLTALGAFRHAMEMLALRNAPGGDIVMPKIRKLGRSYPHHGEQERQRRLRQIAKGMIPPDQIGRLDEAGRVR